jgi:hypothetical protein
MLEMIVLFKLIGENAAEPAAKNQSLEELLVISGVKESLGGSEYQLRAQLTSVKDQFDGEMYDRLYEAVTKAFSPTVLYDSVQTEVQKDLKSEFLEGALSWYHRDLGKKIVELETKKVDRAYITDLKQFASRLTEDDLISDRMDWIDRIDTLARFGSEHQTRSQVLIARVFALAVQAKDGKVIELRDCALQSYMNAMAGALHSINRITLLFAYRTLSDRELEEYARELTKPSMRAFNRFVVNSISKVSADALIKFAAILNDKSKKKMIVSHSKSLPL